jgi:hypothetical protein
VHQFPILNTKHMACKEMAKLWVRGFLVQEIVTS